MYTAVPGIRTPGRYKGNFSLFYIHIPGVFLDVYMNSSVYRSFHPAKNKDSLQQQCEEKTRTHTHQQTHLGVADVAEGRLGLLLLAAKIPHSDVSVRRLATKHTTQQNRQLKAIKKSISTTYVGVTMVERPSGRGGTSLQPMGTTALKKKHTQIARQSRARSFALFCSEHHTQYTTTHVRTCGHLPNKRA